MADNTFNPDEYLAQKTGPTTGFDPDSYLSEKSEGIGQKAAYYLGKGLKAVNSVTIDPINAGIYAAQDGQNPLPAMVHQFGNMTDKAPTGTDIAKRMGLSDERTPIYQYQEPNGPKNQPQMMRSDAEIYGGLHDAVVNPLNYAGSALRAAGKAVNFLSPAGEALEVLDKPSASHIADAAKRLGFSASPGMTSGSETVQGLESSLSQSPSISGALVRKSLAPINNGLTSAAEDLVSGADTSAYDTGNQVSRDIMAKFGQQADQIKASYEPFNKVLPQITLNPQDKIDLATTLKGIADAHKGSTDLSSLGQKFSNGILNADTLGDVEDWRKALGNDISSEMSNTVKNHNSIQTMRNMKDALSDFRDTQFQQNAPNLFPNDPQAGNQMVSQYQNAMKSHANMMNDLRDVGPIFGIKANNPRDFIEAFSEIPPEQLSKRLFKTNDFDALQKVQAYFPDEFSQIKNLKLQELRNGSLTNPIDPVNSSVDPTKLITKINKLSPQVRTILFGDKAQKVQDMQTILGSYPEYIGPSGTPKGEMFTHWADPTQQIGDVARYAGYRALGSKVGTKVINAASALPNAVGNALSNAPNVVGPAASVGVSVNQNTPQGYSDGGTVTPSSSSTTIDPAKAQAAQNSMRKAFGFAAGGTIPGTPQVPMNSPQNDNTLIKATPGEVVLPLSVTQSANAPQKAKEFMANEMMQQQGSMPQQSGPQQMPMIPSQQQMPQAQVMPPGGPEKWAIDGFHNLKLHVDDSDRKWLVDNQDKLMLDPKAKNLLVAGSTFKPGSKPLDEIVQHLKNRMDKVSK